MTSTRATRTINGAREAIATATLAKAFSGEGEAATGFSLYPDALIALVATTEKAEDCVFLPLGHDRETAARLRSIGWRTVAALGEGDSAAALGCTHVLEGGEPVGL